MIFLEYLILFIPLIWETTTDLYRIRVLRKPDNHKQDLLPRFGFCVLAALIITWKFDHPFLPALIWSGCLFISLFDPIMGMALHGKPLYKSPGSQTDQFILGSTPVHAEIFVRLWLLAVGWACYYEWDRVIGR